MKRVTSLSVRVAGGSPLAQMSRSVDEPLTRTGSSLPTRRTRAPPSPRGEVGAMPSPPAVTMRVSTACPCAATFLVARSARAEAWSCFSSASCLPSCSWRCSLLCCTCRARPGFLREVLLVLLAACLLALWMPLGGLVVTWSLVVVSVFAAVCVNLGVCGLV